MLIFVSKLALYCSVFVVPTTCPLTNEQESRNKGKNNFFISILFDKTTFKTLFPTICSDEPSFGHH
jgi:hypothetical protein